MELDGVGRDIKEAWKGRWCAVTAVDGVHMLHAWAPPSDSHAGDGHDTVGGFTTRRSPSPKIDHSTLAERKGRHEQGSRCGFAQVRKLDMSRAASRTLSEPSSAKVDELREPERAELTVAVMRAPVLSRALSWVSLSSPRPTPRSRRHSFAGKGGGLIESFDSSQQLVTSIAEPRKFLRISGKGLKYLDARVAGSKDDDSDIDFGAGGWDLCDFVMRWSSPKNEPEDTELRAFVVHASTFLHSCLESPEYSTSADDEEEERAPFLEDIPVLTETLPTWSNVSANFRGMKSVLRPAFVWHKENAYEWKALVEKYRHAKESGCPKDQLKTTTWLRAIRWWTKVLLNGIFTAIAADSKKARCRLTPARLLRRVYTAFHSIYDDLREPDEKKWSEVAPCYAGDIEGYGTHLQMPGFARKLIFGEQTEHTKHDPIVLREYVERSVHCLDAKLKTVDEQLVAAATAGKTSPRTRFRRFSMKGSAQNLLRRENSMTRSSFVLEDEQEQQKASTALGALEEFETRLENVLAENPARESTPRSSTARAGESETLDETARRDLLLWFLEANRQTEGGYVAPSSVWYVVWMSQMGLGNGWVAEKPPKVASGSYADATIARAVKKAACRAAFLTNSEFVVLQKRSEAAPILTVAAEVDSAVRELLDKCDLSVHSVAKPRGEKQTSTPAQKEVLKQLGSLPPSEQQFLGLLAAYDVAVEAWKVVKEALSEGDVIEAHNGTAELKSLMMKLRVVIQDWLDGGIEQLDSSRERRKSLSRLWRRQHA